MNLNEITSDRWQFIIDHPEKQTQGVHVWYKGVPFPRRAYYDPLKDPNFFLRTLNALGVVKKFLFALTHLKTVVIPRTLNIRKYEPFIQHLCNQFDWILDEFKIKDDEYSVPVWEMGKFIKAFLENLGLSKDSAQRLTTVAMMILEFDNAYRYRAQDMAGETSKERLQNPRKEINRLFDIYLGRELAHKAYPTYGARGKIRNIKLLAYALWLPSVKRAFLKALDTVDLQKMRFDNNDRFHFAFWRGYDYEGKTFEQRFSPYEQIYKQIPFIKRQDPKVTANFMTGQS